MPLENVALIVSILCMVLSTAFSGGLWWRMGTMEQKIKNICPWGPNNCPSFKRAKDEAAPKRELPDEGASG